MTNSNDKQQIINWGGDQLAGVMMYPNIVNRKAKEVHLALRQFSYPHVCGGASVQLFTKPDLSWMIKRSKLFCRDGVMPLIDFFNNLPNPPENLSLLLFAEGLRYVPRNWRTSVRGYAYKTEVTFNADVKPKRLVLAGLLHPLFSSEAELLRRLNPLLEKWGKDFHKSMEILIFFPHTYGLGMHQGSSNEVLKFSQRLHSLIGSDYQIISYNDLMQLSNTMPTAYLEINSDLILSDSHVRHLAFSKGFGQIQMDAAQYQGTSSLVCSPHHEIVTFPTPEDTSFIAWPDQEQIEIYQRLAEITERPVNSTWAPWIELWVTHARRSGL